MEKTGEKPIEKTFGFPSQHTNKITDDPLRQQAFSFLKRDDRYGSKDNTVNCSGIAGRTNTDDTSYIL